MSIAKHWNKLTAGAAAIALILLMMAWHPWNSGDEPEIMVYKSATCGCCEQWVKHLEADGFKVKTQNVADLSQIKQRYGVTQNLLACHTALVDGYVVEGHVPAATIRRLLAERPAIKGLSVPGMPAGSPGMEVGYSEPYAVLAFDANGNSSVYERR
ncbi:MAG: DUF411 domain-containing protein [Gemmatimonadales bacterium]